MKTKKLTTMMTLMAAISLFSASASAQSVNKDRTHDRFDYNLTLQYVGGTAGAGLGGFGGLFAGAAVGAVICSSEFLDCLSGVFIGSGIGMVAGGVTGAVVGTTLTGGDYADEDVYGATVGGAMLGGLAAIPLTFGTIVIINAVSRDSSAVLLTSALVASTSIGVGAAMGYQSNYRISRFESVSLTPMLGEHNGLVLSGRF